MRFLILLYSCLIGGMITIHAQERNETQLFWDSLQKLCGKAYKGTLELPKEDAQFGGKELIMHVRSCTPDRIKVPFFVGEDRSRTWILAYKDNRITLKHDHRHKDGSEDAITQYGGTTTNIGQAGIQIFPADQETTQMLPRAASNVWWITIDNKTFTYNLRRIGSDRVFKIVMDITQPIKTPEAPWGWSDD
ncbi:hypothetical protein [Aquimarina rhabdastrellae]